MRLRVANRALPYASFRNMWRRFVKRARFEKMRPCALRHTFTAVNPRWSESTKTVSVLLERANASHTLDPHVGFIPATTRGLANRYVGKFVPGLVDGGGKHELKEDFR